MVTHGQNSTAFEVKAVCTAYENALKKDNWKVKELTAQEVNRKMHL